MAARLTGGQLLWVPNKVMSDEAIITFQEQLELPITIGEFSVKLDLVIGTLMCPTDASDTEQLFSQINIVIDEAKMTRKRFLHYEAVMEERYQYRLSIINHLKQALDTKSEEFSLFYQPKLDLNSDKIMGAEALLRWHNNTLGFVSPEDFIPIAERSGLIHDITDWVLCQAIKDLKVFRIQGVTLNIAVNLSAKDLLQTELVDNILSKLEKESFGPSAISFEITEGDMINDTQATIKKMQQLQQKGFHIAIDDFGTGYSSMAYLQNLPVNTLKIDKAFVLDLDKKSSDQNIVKAIIDLAHSFQLNIIAEGVENSSALAMLKQMGCENAQGYFIAKPMPADQLLIWLKSNMNKNWLEQVV